MIALLLIRKVATVATGASLFCLESQTAKEGRSEAFALLFEEATLCSEAWNALKVEKVQKNGRTQQQQK